jgi:hypothetical protein
MYLFYFYNAKSAIVGRAMYRVPTAAPGQCIRYRRVMSNVTYLFVRTPPPSLMRIKDEFSNPDVSSFFNFLFEQPEMSQLLPARADLLATARVLNFLFL